MDKAKKRIDEAAKYNDIGTIRELIIDVLTRRPADRESLDIVAYAMDKSPDLFDEDDMTVETLSKEEWTDGYARKVGDALKRNFSRRKLSMYAETMTELARNPKAHELANEKESDGARYAARMERQAAKEEAALQDSLRKAEERDAREEEKLREGKARYESDAVLSERVARPSGVMKIIGYILMALGAATSIVGLCVPVRFMIGLGIGIILLGIALVYINLHNH